MRSLWLSFLSALVIYACGGGGGTTVGEEDLTSHEDIVAGDVGLDTPCVPACAGFECGDDGCGGSCGECGIGATCEDGVCEAVLPECGNGDCANFETCETCPEDCGECCGNGTCDTGWGEDCETCPADCGECHPDCGDTICGEGEDCASCPEDCGCEEGNVCGPDLTCVPGLGCAQVWQCLGECDQGADCLDICTELATDEAKAWIDAVVACLSEHCDLEDQSCVEEAIENECADVVGECCIPDCGNKDCGDDGCGGNCGVCGDLMTCVDGHCDCIYAVCGEVCCDNEEAVCHENECCIPACDDAECGDDGCGGVCGECPADGLWICDAGICTCINEVCGDVCCQYPAMVCFEEACCLSVCDGKNCGDDQCGGSCGECSWPQPDCVDNVCICAPKCDGKECGGDECGGECGTCDPGENCVDFQCLSTVGPEIIANQITDGSQMEPELLRLDDGNVLLAWQSKPTADYVFELKGRIFSATGEAVGDEFPISGELPVANNAEVRLFQMPGGFLAAWNSSKVHMVWLDNGGSVVAGPVTPVDSDDTYRTYLPFAENGTPRFLYSSDAPANTEDFFLGTLDGALAWEADQPVALDWLSEMPASSLVLGLGGVFAVGFWEGTVGTFLWEGAEATAPVAVTATMPDGLYDKPYPRLALLADGSYVAVYDLVTDDASLEVRATRLAQNLSIIDQDVVLNTVTEGYQWKARVSALTDGGYIVAWQSDNLDGDSTGVGVRLVGSDGVPMGTVEMSVPEYTEGYQQDPAILAIEETSNVMVAWSSGAHPDMGEIYDISLRVLPINLFED